MTDPLDQAPPWQVFPDLTPADAGARQGAQEAWVDQVWRPFWATLTPAQRQAYLDHWGASDEWRHAIRATFEPEPAFDAEADLTESERHLAERRAAASEAQAGGWVQRIGRLLGRR
jgi:hypothetical protein